MKFLLIIPVLAFTLLTSCYRVTPPLDPMTMKPSDRCLPGATQTVIDSGK